VDTPGDTGNTNGGPNFSRGFDTAFTKLLWPLVLFSTEMTVQLFVLLATVWSTLHRYCEFCHCYRIEILPKGVLLFKSVEVNDSGVYTCLAVNEFGSTSKNITLTVLGEPQFQYFHTPVANNCLCNSLVLLLQ